MGRNAAIKRYDVTPAGQPVELLGSKQGRLPAILEVLRSPWVMRASELPPRDGSWATKHAGEPVEIVWDAKHRCPGAFLRAGQLWHVDSVVQTWSIERTWWDPRRRISRRIWRVIARGGVYDLAFDRLERGWLLLGIED